MTKISFVLVSLLLYLGCQADQPQHLGSGTEPRTTPSAVPTGSFHQTVELNPIKLSPVDEAQQDSSFAYFRKSLFAAADNHDSQFVLSILDPKIINGIDHERGEKAFKQLWRLDESDSKFWKALTSVLSLGGSFRDNDGTIEFCAPYVTSKWSTVFNQLPKDADPLNYQVIIDKNVQLRSEPKLEAAVITTLNYDIVRVYSTRSVTGSESSNGNWLNIGTFSGQRGFVLQDVVRSPSDYQACFKKTGARWVMTEFAARE